MNRDNHFNLIRLMLAGSVIVGHGFLLHCRGLNADPVYNLGGVIDLASVAVDAFFILSGYLITASWMAKPKVTAFAGKRVRRIYPGFIVCSLFCVFIVGPISNSHYLATAPLMSNFRHMLTLAGPGGDGFPGTFHADLNTSMWTIQFEFACYAMVAALGFVRCLNRWTVAGLLVLALALSFTHPSMWYAEKAVRLAPFFLAGMCCQLWQPKWTGRMAGLCAVLVLGAVWSEWGIRLVLPIAGAYMLFTIAFRSSTLMTRLRPGDDISYGVYLYGWPVQKLVLMYWPGIDVVSYVLVSLGATSVLAWVSWKVVEAPFMRSRASESRKP